VTADRLNLIQVMLAEEKNMIEIKSQTKIVAEATILISLSSALYYTSRIYLPFFHLPEGGSITVASMVPLFWFALRRGLRWGVEAGTVYGLVHIVLSGGVYYPTQILLDYPLAFGALGLAGAFRKRPLVGVAVGMTGRFICHFISGVVFFAAYAWPGWSPIPYSAAYNASYLVPEFIISSIIMYIIVKRQLLEIYL
jgi:thiamine transporter